LIDATMEILDIVFPVVPHSIFVVVVEDVTSQNSNWIGYLVLATMGILDFVFQFST